MITATPKLYDKKQYAKLAAAVYGENLKDGEQRTMVAPGFDFRGMPEDGKYGQKTPTLIFAERRGDKAIDIQFYMGWCMDGSTHEPMCSGLYFHADKKTTEYSHDTDNCPFTGGKCYGNAGSALYGDEIFARLMSEGSPAVWDEIDKAFKEFES